MKYYGKNKLQQTFLLKEGDWIKELIRIFISISCVWKFSLGLVLLGQPVPVMADGQINDLVLENKHVQFVISGNNGTILKAKQKDSSQWVFTGSCDYYKAINEDGENRTRESKDEVVSSQKSQVADGYIVRLECTNSGWNKIKLRIIKEYKIWDKEPIVTKHTTFINEGEKGVFIETWSSVQLNPKWLEGGHFYLPYPHSQPELPVPEENKEEMILSAVYAPIGCLATAAVNKNRSILAASYTYEANGVFCMPVYASSTGSSYTGYAPRVSWQGWRHFSYRDYIKPHGRSTLSVNYTIIPDNSSGLYKQWVSLPAYKKIESPYPVPDWLEDVKLMMFPYPNPDELFDEWRIQRLVELSKKLPDTYIMPVFNSYGYASGEFPLYGDYQIKLKKGIEKYHSLSPYIKLGTYIIPQYVYAESQIMKEHPEWAVRDKEGKYQQTDMGEHYLAQPAWENFRQYCAESIGKVFDNWKLDYLYIDIVHSGFGFCFDWGNHMVTQPKDYYLLWRSLLDAVKARGNDKVLFCNTPNYPLQEAGFCEMGGGLWGANSPDYNWRGISDSLYYSKIFQTGKKWVSPLYPYSLDRYFSFVLALALKPNFAMRTSQDWQTYYDSWDSYVNAAFEISRASLIDVETGPSWRSDPNVKIDTFSLKCGKAVLLTAINHDKVAIDTVLSADTQRFGFEIGRPIFVWETEMINPIQEGVKDKSINVQSFKILDTMPTSLNVNVNLRPELAKIVGLTQTPAFVYSVKDYKTQFRLPETMGVTIDGSFTKDNHKMTLNVKTKQECEIIIWWPEDGKKPTNLTLDGNIVEIKELYEMVHKFLLVKVPSGVHTINIF